MKTLSSASKILFVTAALGLALAGCERRPADQTSGASGTSGTSASGGAMGSSPSGASGTKGSSTSGAGAK